MANDVFRVVLSWDAPNGSEHQNVLFFKIPGGDSANVADLVSDIADMIAAWAADWLGRLVVAYVLDFVKVYAFDVATGISTPLGTASMGFVGTSAFLSALPGGCRVKVNIFPPNRPRPGGVYLPAPNTNLIEDDGLLTAGAQAGALSTAADLLTAFSLGTTGLNAQCGLYSSKDSAFISYAGGSAQVDSTMDYQRRGKAGVGI